MAASIRTRGRKATLRNEEPGPELIRETRPDARSTGPSFAPVKTKRVFEVICDQVRREMATGALRPGDKLPAERDLALKFGVSRTGVREALRSLEIAGVVGLQKGVKGGAFILKGDPDLVTRSIRDMFYLGQLSLDDLTEARTLVMQMAIELAMARMKPELLAELERNVTQLAALPRTATISERLALGSQFYALLARATENKALQVVIESFTAIVLQQVEQFKVGTLPDVIAHRRRLVALLSTRRAEDAKREMTNHLGRLHKHLASAEKARARARSH